MPNRSLRLLLSALLTAVFVLSSTTDAAAETLSGRVEDSLTDRGVPDATVRVLGTNRVVRTGPDGQWAFDLPPGDYQLAVTAQIGQHRHRFRVVRQRVPQYKPSDTHVYTTHFSETAPPLDVRASGFPAPRIDHPSARDRGPVSLDPAPEAPAPGRLTLPDEAPTTIRVARREDEETCVDSPVIAIEEMSLESYVRGVLVPEIGVFQNLDGVTEVYEAFARAAKSYGLYFALVYGPDNRRWVDSAKPPHGYRWFHIDDTPCNQRYSDKRLDITDRAASRVEGEILVREDAPNTLDKYEYAASCGEHGTRPAYRDEIVPDESTARSCIGDWCGHTSCAGHADHPDVPGSDSCLVRGICQWGAAEWAESGRDDRFILEHYQPELTVRQLPDDGDDRRTVDLTGWVFSNPDDIPGSGIPGATVELNANRTTRTDGRGVYLFEDVPLSSGTVTVTAEKSGWSRGRRDKRLVEGQTNWASIRLSRPVDSSDPADAGSDAADGSIEDAGMERDAGRGDDERRRGADGTERDPWRGIGPLLSNSKGKRTNGPGCSGCATRAPRPVPSSLLLVALFYLRIGRND